MRSNLINNLTFCDNVLPRRGVYWTDWESTNERRSSVDRVRRLAKKFRTSENGILPPPSTCSLVSSSCNITVNYLIDHHDKQQNNNTILIIHLFMCIHGEFFITPWENVNPFNFWPPAKVGKKSFLP